MEKTVVLIKPDGLQRGLVGEIMHRFERKGLKLVGIKMIRLTDDILENWYFHHKDKAFFKDLNESAEKELGLIFNIDEIFDYQSSMDPLIYSKEEVG